MQNAIVSNDQLDGGMVASLLSIAKSIRALHGVKLAELGFYNGQDELLIAADDQGTTVTEIAAKLAIRPSTVSKMMDRLIGKGLVERVGDPRDARRTLVRITKKGVAARLQLLELRQNLEKDLARSFGDEAYPVMAASLAECQIHIVRQLDRLR